MKKLLKVLFAMILMAFAITPLFSQSQTETLMVLMDPGKDEIVLNPYTASDSNSIVMTGFSATILRQASLFPLWQRATVSLMTGSDGHSASKKPSSQTGRTSQAAHSPSHGTT